MSLICNHISSSGSIPTVQFLAILMVILTLKAKAESCFLPTILYCFRWVINFFSYASFAMYCEQYNAAYFRRTKSSHHLCISRLEFHSIIHNMVNICDKKRINFICFFESGFYFPFIGTIFSSKCSYVLITPSSLFANNFEWTIFLLDKKVDNHYCKLYSIFSKSSNIMILESYLYRCCVKFRNFHLL